MKLTKKKLESAAEANIISFQQVDTLYDFLLTQSEGAPRFTFIHVLYYLGGLIAIGAMTIFMNIGWESFAGAGIFFISLLYSGVGLKLSNVFSAKELPIPAGICATFVVCLTPLTIYGLQQWLGLWPDETVYNQYHRYIKWHWIYMELGTLAVGVIVAWKYKYPFLMMPIAVTLWYMTMDVAAIISGLESHTNARSDGRQAKCAVHAGRIHIEQSLTDDRPVEPRQQHLVHRGIHARGQPRG